MQVGTYLTPKTGFEYVSYNATVTNNKVPNLMISPSYFSLKTSDGKVYDTDSAMYDSSVNGFQLVSSSQPGDVVSGTIIFQIPTTATPASILYNDYSHMITTTL